MSDKMKVRDGNDGYSYPYTSPDLVIDKNGKSVTKKFEDVNTQFKDIAKTVGTETLNTTAQDLKGAINEVFQNASNGKTLIAQAITGKGVKATSNDTWQQLATKISQIEQNLPIKVNTIKQLKDGWKFNLISTTSNVDYNSVAEANKTYDDNAWQSVTVPHDWSIYLPFNANSLAGSTGGFLDGGDAWYRRRIDTSEMKRQKVYIYFDGAYMESNVYVNGIKVGQNKNGYNPFYFDITEQLNFDGNDILAVFVRNNQPSSRWYSGSGIYRNVYLVSANDISIGIGDVFVTTPTLETDISTSVANTKIDVKINSTTAKTVNLVNEIYFNNSLVKSNTKEITLSIGSNSATDTIQINNPTLWDTHNGNLYTLKTYIKEGETIYHSTITMYGYRYFKFDKDTGFWLNGKNFKLHGFCMHHDLGCLGSEINKSAIERQIRLLKDIGCNAIRLTHNPSSPEMLEVCAKEGILLIEELFDVWTVHKVTNDYATYFLTDYENVIKTTINRSKNNPAIIMWSLGNEIYDVRSDKTPTQDAITTITALINAVKAIDNTRPLTCGDNQRGTNTTDIHNQVNDLLDVVGWNYLSKDHLSTVHTNFPNWCNYISEGMSAYGSRGIYAHNDTTQQCSSYDEEKAGWGLNVRVAIWQYEQLPYLAGYFPWTGFDYIGEPTPYLDDSKYPSKSSYFGAYDLCGFPKDMAYLYKAKWTFKPMVHILPHWNWTSSDTVKVWVYTNCYRVELILNGVSVGSKLLSSSYYGELEFNIPWEEGELVVNAYDKYYNLIAQDKVVTSTGCKKILLSSDKSSVNIGSDDLVFITCDIVDSNNNIYPTAENEITFSVEGGTIVGVDNGNPASVEPFKNTNKRKAFSGKCLCVVKPSSETGNIVVTAISNGLTNGTITISKSNKTTLNPLSENQIVDNMNNSQFKCDYILKPNSDGIIPRTNIPITIGQHLKIQLWSSNADGNMIYDGRKCGISYLTNSYSDDREHIIETNPVTSDGNIIISGNSKNELTNGELHANLVRVTIINPTTT